MELLPHSKEWYERLAKMQKGYSSTTGDMDIGSFSGEEVYLKLVREHLSPEKDVLEVGCGHGDVALDFASLCRSIIAYDRIASYIELARENAQRRQIENVCQVSRHRVHFFQLK